MLPFWPLAGFAGVFVLTALGLRALIPWLTARRVLDVPNERSSHVAATPRGGGLAPVAALAAGGGAGALLSGSAWPLTFAVLAWMLCLLSFADDRRSLGVALRFAAQFTAVAAAWGLTMWRWPPLLGEALPAAAIAPLLLLGWIWFINLYNFMDGIDGISGVETASIGLGAALVAHAAGGAGPGLHGPIMIAGLMLAGAGCGFLTANWHPARVFLGDAGSIPLGFLAGALLIALAASGQVAAALILPAYYIVDATVTLARRLARGEKVWIAHRQHAYQAAVRAGLSHSDVCRRLLGLNAVLALLALASLRQPLLSLAAGYAAAFVLYALLLRRGAAAGAS